MTDGKSGTEIDIENTEEWLAEAKAAGDKRAVRELTRELVDLRHTLKIEAGEILADAPAPKGGNPAKMGIHSDPRLA